MSYPHNRAPAGVPLVVGAAYHLTGRRREPACGYRFKAKGLLHVEPERLRRWVELGLVCRCCARLVP